MIDIDRAFVAQQRARRFSWQAIAGQLGVCEHDLRRICDLGFTPTFVAQERPPKPPKKPKPKRTKRLTGPVVNGRHVTQLEGAFHTLAMANGCYVETANLHKNWQSAMNIISQLRARYGKNIIARYPHGGAYKLTEEGLSAYRERRPDTAEVWIDRRRERAA